MAARVRACVCLRAAHVGVCSGAEARLREFTEHLLQANTAQAWNKTAAGRISRHGPTSRGPGVCACACNHVDVREGVCTSVCVHV